MSEKKLYKMVDEQVAAAITCLERGEDAHHRPLEERVTCTSARMALEQPVPALHLSDTRCSHASRAKELALALIDTQRPEKSALRAVDEHSQTTGWRYFPEGRTGLCEQPHWVVTTEIVDDGCAGSVAQLLEAHQAKQMSQEIAWAQLGHDQLMTMMATRGNHAQKTGWVYVVVSAATVNEPWAVPGYWLCTQTFIDA